MGGAEIDVVLEAVDLLTLMIQELPARVAGEAGADVTPRRLGLMRAVDALVAGETAAPSDDPAAGDTPDLLADAAGEGARVRRRGATTGRARSRSTPGNSTTSSTWSASW